MFYIIIMIEYTQVILIKLKKKNILINQKSDKMLKIIIFQTLIKNISDISFRKHLFSTQVMNF